MKKTYLYMVVCAAALMMAGCAQDTTDANGNFPKAEKISIGAKIANPEQNRTGLDEDYDGIRAVYWEADDQIALIDDMDAVKVLSLNPEEEMWGPENIGYTMFYGEALVDFSQKRYPAIYPASAVESGDRNSISLTLPEVQTRVEGGGTLMYATNSQDDTTTVDGAYLEFVNLVGYLELQVVGECSVSEVIVESASKKLSGAATLVPVYEAGELPELTVTGSNAVTLAPAEAVALDPSTPTSLFVALPADTYPAGDLSIKFITNEGPMMMVSSQEHVLEVSHIKPLTMTVASNVEFVDLTAGEKYANTFIVTGEGYYKFAARTRDGHIAVPHPKTGETMLNIGGETAQACCAWETAEGIVSEVSYDAVENTISFYYSGLKGGAMISMVDNALSQWHWLIWATDQPADQVIGNNTYMDRNLGAWDTPANVEAGHDFLNRDYDVPGGKMASATGFTWQWGRPIPYPSVGRSHVRYSENGWSSRSVYQRETSNAVTCADLWVETSATKKTDNTAEDVIMGYSPKFYFPGGDIMQPLYIDRSGVAISYVKGNETVFVPWTNRWNGVNSTNNVPMSLAIQKPFHIYGSANNASISHIKYWCNDVFADSFDFGSASSPWNYGEGANAGKTFDVCPYGYHIPDGEQAVADFSTLTFTWRDRYNNADTSKDGLTAGTTHTVAAYATTPAGDFVWIPTSGGRVYYGGLADWDSINLWCSANNNQKTVLTFAQYGKSNTTNAQVVDGFVDIPDEGDSLKQGIQESAISTTFAIRCVKDK